MQVLPKGTKIKMLNNCRHKTFKKGDVLTIDYIDFNTYHCLELDIYNDQTLVDDKDKFEIIILQIFNELGD